MIFHQGSIPNPVENRTGTGGLMILNVALVALLLVRSQKPLSLIKKIHRSVIDSSANGLTNCSLIMIVFLCFLFSLVATVRIWFYFTTRTLDCM